jgi:hypothetical protein
MRIPTRLRQELTRRRVCQWCGQGPIEEGNQFQLFRFGGADTVIHFHPCKDEWDVVQFDPGMMAGKPAIELFERYRKWQPSMKEVRALTGT